MKNGRVKFAAAAALALLAWGCAKSAPAVVKIEVTDDGFVPATAIVPKGKPYTLQVTRKSDATCATSMVFDPSGRRVLLPLDSTVTVAMPASDADTTHYACGMGMISGQLVAK